MTKTIKISLFTMLVMVLAIVNVASFVTVLTGCNGSNVTSDSDVISTADISDTTTTETRQEVVLELPYYIEIDKVGQIVSVYTTNEEGKYEKLVRQMICSTGENINALPDGVYPLKENRNEWCTMLSRGEPLYAQYTTKITGSYLFHSVPYLKWGDKSSLSVNRYEKLGTACSGGCIRLTVEGAKWIYDNCPPGTPVRVFCGEVYDADLVESLRPAQPVGGWDPTDPDPANPDYRPLITTPDPEPDKYAPLYDYKWEWAKEQPRIYYTTTTTTESDTEETTTTSSESSDSEETTTTTTTATTETTTTTTTAASQDSSQTEGEE